MSFNRGMKRDSFDNRNFNNRGSGGGSIGGGGMGGGGGEGMGGGGGGGGGMMSGPGILPTPDNNLALASPQAQLAIACSLLSNILRSQQEVQPQVPSLLSLGNNFGRPGPNFHGQQNFGPGRFNDRPMRHPMKNNRPQPYNKFFKKNLEDSIIVSTMRKRNLKSMSSCKPLAKKAHWSLGLLDSVNDPQYKVKEDNRIIVIKDKYPKAQFHYLVLPKEDIAGILNVTKEHEDLLEHMEKIGEKLTEDHPDHEFIFGYHALPSMYRLHLHVISTDFVSTHLKTKHNWNSFTSPYFRRSQDIRKELHEYGHIKKISPNVCEKYLKADLKCHKCSTILKNIPNLKSHLLTHLSDKKSSLQTCSTLSS